MAAIFKAWISIKVPEIFKFKMIGQLFQIKVMLASSILGQFLLGSKVRFLVYHSYKFLIPYSSYLTHELKANL